MAKKRLFRNLSLSQQIKLYFLARGYKEVPSRCKYTVMASPTDTVHYIFLGRSGAIRHNHKIAASTSRDVSGYFMKGIRSWIAEQNPEQLTEIG